MEVGSWKLDAGGGDMAIKSYRDFEVYQRAHKLIIPIYKLADSLPKDERFDLRSQMRRACKSVVSNFVEGYSHKDTPTKMKSFWRNSMGSANEMVEHLEQAVMLDYISAANTEPHVAEYTIIAKQLNVLIKNWRKF
ncbi:MAG: four helix bundle protein [Chloroflexota bacterium]